MLEKFLGYKSSINSLDSLLTTKIFVHLPRLVMGFVIIIFLSNMVNTINIFKQYAP
jgi:hypothetical protein